MPRDELNKTLQELKVELDKVHFDYEERRTSVNDNVAMLELKLREESLMSGDEFIVNELKEALEEFEENHPRITDLVSRVSDLLAKMGI